MNLLPVISWLRRACVAAVVLISVLSVASGQRPRPAEAPKGPWMDKSLPPDQRADMVVGQMTLDEKIRLVHGVGWDIMSPVPLDDPAKESLRLLAKAGAGFVPGIPRLGIPAIRMADSAVGVRNGDAMGRYSTLLPSTLGAASSWDPQAAFLYGSVIGRELRDQGFNQTIGGGVNITREPRNGRNFEYAGEDPILAGTMVGNLEKGVQAQQVMGDIKHYALNDQETGRNIGNVVIDKRSMRESDLLAFQIALKISNAAAFMCAYNKINGDYACENDYTLNQVLKHDFGFKGWVMSDWGGTHSTVKAANAGLDQEMPGSDLFGSKLKTAVDSRQVSEARLDDMCHRILRSMFAVGVVDNPPQGQVPDIFRGFDDSRHIAEQSIVLLKNTGPVLPLSAASTHSIALIGSHADVGVLSGGGSAQVDPPGGNAVPELGTGWQHPQWFPSSPLKEIRDKAPGARVEFNAGTDADAAASFAKGFDVAIVFVNQYMTEDHDAKTLALPDNQDALVRAVARANPHTIVVAETGGPVTMPWIDHVQGVLEAWYPGICGAQALANILFGDVNPSAKLPVTFAKSDADLPHPKIPGPPPKDFNIPYTEGLKVGYKWYDAEKIEPLFPFGYGLSYTTYAYSGLHASGSGKNVSVSFEVRNAGQRAGAEIAQVYVALPPGTGEPPRRLVAWQKVQLDPGQSKTVTLALDPFYLSIFNADKDGWELPAGEYTILVGSSSRELPLRAAVNIAE